MKDSNWEADWCQHPGELISEYRQNLRYSLHDLAGELGLTVGELLEIEAGLEGIDELLSELLSRSFGTTKEFWMKLQSNYEEDYNRIYKHK